MPNRARCDYFRRHSGAMQSIEPGISRFRVWSFGPSRNDDGGIVEQARAALTGGIVGTKKRGANPALSSNSMRRGSLADSRRPLGFLDDAGRLATQIAQVIQLGAAHLAAAHHLDRVDHRRHYGEYAFDAFTVGDLAHRKTLVEPAAGAADADAFVSLHARAIAFNDLDIDDHGVAGSEFRNLFAGGQFFKLLFFELLNEVHGGFSIGGAPQPRNARARASIRLSCADLAPVYGKGRALSPFRRGFWRLLAAVFGRPKVGPPRLGQGLRLGEPPGRDSGVVA